MKWLMIICFTWKLVLKTRLMVVSFRGFLSLSLCVSVCVYQAIRTVLRQDLFPQIKLWEFYQVKVENAVEQFRILLQNGV